VYFANGQTDRTLVPYIHKAIYKPNSITNLPNKKWWHYNRSKKDTHVTLYSLQNLWHCNETYHDTHMYFFMTHICGLFTTQLIFDTLLSTTYYINDTLISNYSVYDTCRAHFNEYIYNDTPSLYFYDTLMTSQRRPFKSLGYEYYDLMTPLSKHLRYLRHTSPCHNRLYDNCMTHFGDTLFITVTFLWHTKAVLRKDSDNLFRYFKLHRLSILIINILGATYYLPIWR
jgi:hypothetical protein